MHVEAMWRVGAGLWLPGWEPRSSTLVCSRQRIMTTHLGDSAPPVSQDPTGSASRYTLPPSFSSHTGPLAISPSPCIHPHILTLSHTLMVSHTLTHIASYTLTYAPAIPLPGIVFPQVSAGLTPHFCFPQKPVLTTHHTHVSSSALIFFQEGTVT